MIKTIEMHMYLAVGEYGSHTTVDSIDWRKYDNCMKGRTWLGSQQVEFNFPDVDERQIAIDTLKSDVESVRAKAQSEVNVLLDRISKLQSLGHEPTE